MTAQEYDTTTDIDALLRSVRGRVSDRKMMLFAGGCCRLGEGRVPLAGSLAERFESRAGQPLPADEKLSLVSAAFRLFSGDLKGLFEHMLRNLEQNSWDMAWHVASFVRQLQTQPREPEDSSDAEPSVETLAEGPATREQAALFREIVGPHAVEPFDPHWRTETVAELARTIEDEPAWDRMPILADALQDAGCEDADILAHCRGPHAGHRRGCWVIDAILDRP